MLDIGFDVLLVMTRYKVWVLTQVVERAEDCCRIEALRIGATHAVTKDAIPRSLLHRLNTHLTAASVPRRS